jgi:hypothetical protein
MAIDNKSLQSKVILKYLERIINDPNFLQEEIDSKLSANNFGYYLVNNIPISALLNKYMTY